MTAATQDPGRGVPPSAALPPRRTPAPPAALPHACEHLPSGDVSGTPPSTAAWSAGRSASRLVGIDAARGLALVGMVSVHNIAAFDEDGTISTAWALSSGKAAALFAVLAGVGLAFASGGRRRPVGRVWCAHGAGLLARALVIGAVGLLIGHVVPTDYAAVILPYYAVLFLFAVPLLGLPTRVLIALAATVTLGVPLLSHVVRSGGSLVVPANLTFHRVAADPGGTLRDLTLTGAYPTLAWVAYLCAGLAVGRALLSSRRTVALIALTGITLVVAAPTVSWLLLDVGGGRADLEAVALASMSRYDFHATLAAGFDGVTPADTWWWMATLAPHSSTPLDLAFTIGVSLAVLGCCILLGRSTTALLRPLAAAGSMTLTLYCLHLLLLSWSGMPSRVPGFLIQTVLLVAFALVWARWHARGPLEQIVAEASDAVRRRVGGRAARPPDQPAPRRA